MECFLNYVCTAKIDIPEPLPKMLIVSIEFNPSGCSFGKLILIDKKNKYNTNTTVK